MKRPQCAAIIAVVVSLLVGCVAYSTYNNLEPISPKPHSARIYAPVGVDSLHPVFMWRGTSPDQKVDLAIWEAVYKGTGFRNNTSNYGKGALVYYQEGIPGGEHQVQTNLAPRTIYFWSIKPTGTTSWSTANHAAVLPTEFEEAHGLFFSIKTPAQ